MNHPWVFFYSGILKKLKETINPFNDENVQVQRKYYYYRRPNGDQSETDMPDR